MDNLQTLYMSSDGRIGRQQWWLGVVILIVINVAITLIAGWIFGLWNNVTASAWLSLILFLIFGYPIYNLYLKRRHDRDNNGMDATIFLGVLVVSLLLQALGLGYTQGEVMGRTVMVPTAIGGIVGLVVLVYGIYMIVQMGFLKGTTGPNSYGPDPLGG